MSVRAGPIMNAPLRLAHDRLGQAPGVVRGDRVIVRVLRGGRQGELELNPAHPVFSKLKARHALSPEDAGLADLADLVVGCALLAEGSELPDRTRFVRLLAGLMVN